MMKKYLFVLLVLLGLASVSFAKPVTPADIRAAVEGWTGKSSHFQRMKTPFVRESYTIRSIDKITLAPGSMPLYAVTLDPEGYIVMNSDRRLPPVIAYSEVGSFSLENIPQNAFRALLKGSMKKGWKKMMKVSNSADAIDIFQPLEEAENELQWEQLLDPGQADYLVADASSVDVGPFLTTTWNQNNHYNERCPVDGAASEYYDGHVPVGCVAVAGAQIMNFYQWPYRGAGGHSYTDGGTIGGAHSVDFSDPFDWASMQSSYSAWGSEPQAAVDAVSELMYETGVAVEMDYEHLGSSSSTYDLRDMMHSAFLYEKGTYLNAGTNWGSVASQLKPDMLALRPAVLSVPGHAVVADGFRDEGLGEFFHANYGWNGSSNGWYLIDGLYLGAGDGCVTGLYPDMVPVNVTEDGSTNASSDVALVWAFAAVREAEVQSVSVLNHVLENSTFTDSVNDFSDFQITSTTDFKDWAISSSGYSGNCFYKVVGGHSNREYHLTSVEKFVAESGSQLSFRLKTSLNRDVFRVMVSDNNGQEFLEVGSYDPGMSWTLVTVNLSSYVGSEILIRFEYVVDGGWAGGGVWLDEIEFSGGGWYDWETVQTSSSVTGATVSLPEGTNTLALQAYDGSEYGPQSPSFNIVVESAGNDIDEDGLPNDWEMSYFDSETAADPSAMASNGVNTLLQAYIAGLNPTNTAAFFKAVFVSGYVVQWNVASGRVYSVWSTTNLIDGFQTLETNVSWPQSSWTDAVERAENFYKVDVELQ